MLMVGAMQLSFEFALVLVTNIVAIAIAYSNLNSKVNALDKEIAKLLTFFDPKQVEERTRREEQNLATTKAIERAVDKVVQDLQHLQKVSLPRMWEELNHLGSVSNKRRSDADGEDFEIRNGQ